MKKLEMNEYLTGLKKLFEDYGVQRVTTDGLATDGKFNAFFFTEPELTAEAYDVLNTYMSSDDCEIYAAITAPIVDTTPELSVLYYSGGCFYTKGD